MHLPLVDVFGDDEIARLFSEEAMLEAWLAVERALATAQGELGVIPADDATAVVEAAVPGHIDLARLRDRTRTVGYPILPLLEQVATVSDEAGRYVHWGATTQDIMDSGLALVTGRALQRVEELVRVLGDEIAAAAEAHRLTVMPGRTHAQPAVPVTFGSKLAVWLSELTRHLERLHAVRERVVVVQLFGAAGTAAALGKDSRAVRHRVAELLGLGIVDVPWHTARDAIAEVGFVLAAVAGTCGKVAREVIELSRPEIGEVREQAGDHRGASSTMPQKANPIGAEVTVGMSILAAEQVGALLAALQGTHERAAGEWQAEWDALPLAFAAAAGAASNAGALIAGLQVFPERMRANLAADGGTLMAEAVMMAAANVVGRAAAHDVVYAASLHARTSGVAFEAALADTMEPELLQALPPLASLLDPSSYLGEANLIVTAAAAQWKQVTTAATPEAETARR